MQVESSWDWFWWLRVSSSGGRQMSHWQAKRKGGLFQVWGWERRAGGQAQAAACSSVGELSRHRPWGSFGVWSLDVWQTGIMRRKLPASQELPSTSSTTFLEVEENPGPQFSVPPHFISAFWSLIGQSSNCYLKWSWILRKLCGNDLLKAARNGAALTRWLWIKVFITHALPSCPCNRSVCSLDVGPC